MRSLVIVLGIVAISAWVLIGRLPAEAEPSVSARAQEVQSVALEGRGLPMALRTVLATHAGDQLDAGKLDHDRAALEAALVARGYLAARVEPAQVSFDAGGGAFVTFAIARGSEFHVRKVSVTGTTERDAGTVTLAGGEVAMADRIARVRDALAERLAARGGKPGAVAMRVVPDDAAAAVDVELVAR